MTPTDCSPPGSPGILQARTLELVAIIFSSDLPDPGIETESLELLADSLPSEPPGGGLYFIYSYYMFLHYISLPSWLEYPLIIQPLFKISLLNTFIFPTLLLKGFLHKSNGNEMWHCTFPSSICHEGIGPDAMIFVFWMLSFKPAFSFSSFTSSRGSLVPPHFWPLNWYHLHIWSCWYFSMIVYKSLFLIGSTFKTIIFLNLTREIWWVF